MFTKSADALSALDAVKAKIDALSGEMKNVNDKVAAGDGSPGLKERGGNLMAGLGRLQRERDELNEQWSTLLLDEIKSGKAGTESGGSDGPTSHKGGASRTANADEEWGLKAAERVRAAGAGLGLKALVSGTIDIPNPVLTDVVYNPQAVTTFLDLITTRRQISGQNNFSYLRQTVRTNNAAPVADGATKPTSVFTVAEVEDTVQVIAHLSEAIPERYLADHAQLGRFLEQEMRAGVMQALEAQVAAGDGTAPNLSGILDVSGTTAVAYNTGKLVTARKALTALELLNEKPNAWVLNPADSETFDLTSSADGVYLIPPGDPLWRIPRFTSAQVPAGTAILADWRQALLVIREDATLAGDRSGTLFDKNQVKLRMEGRYGFGVLRPQAFAVVDLTP